MKTAISIPDEIFDAAERAAKRLGMSRSELYVNAVREYVERYGRANIVEKLDEVYSNSQASPGVDPVLDRLQYSSLPRENW